MTDRVSELLIELLEQMPEGQHDRLQELARAIDAQTTATFKQGVAKGERQALASLAQDRERLNQ